QYVGAKREAEDYVRRVGVNAVIVRAPLAYRRGAPRPLFYQLISALRFVPPLGLLGLHRIAPLPVDILARSVARAALNPRAVKPVLYAPDLRRMNTREERLGQAAPVSMDDLPSSLESLDDVPIGFIPK